MKTDQKIQLYNKQEKLSSRILINPLKRIKRQRTGQQKAVVWVSEQEPYSNVQGIAVA